MTKLDLKEHDIVVIRAFEDEWPEHLFRVTDVWWTCRAFVPPQVLV